MRNLFFAALAVFSAAFSTQAQISTAGEVVDVLDGRTVVVQIPAGRVKVELQYIEVPEPGQPMHEAVREHLRKMLVGKTVVLRSRTLFDDRTIGRITLRDVDVSQQLIRDGAAWHVPLIKSGQEPSEYQMYAALEASARDEKRGIWSQSNLKPAWEYRAEQAAAGKAALSTPASAKYEMPPPAEKRKGYWSDKNPYLGNIGALRHGYNAESRLGYVGTTMLGIRHVDEAKTKENDEKTAVDITYYYKEVDGKGRQGKFILTVVSMGRTARFTKNNNLILKANERSSVIARARGRSETTRDHVFEELKYEISRSSMERFVNGADVTLRIGDYMIRPSEGMHLLLYNMLQVAAGK